MAAILSNFVEAPKVKIVRAIGNVLLSSAEEGELYYDVATGKLNLRVDSGWLLFTKD